MVFEVLFLLGDVWSLVFDESLGLVVSGEISGEVLGLCIRVALGRQVASGSRRECSVGRRVRLSSADMTPSIQSRYNAIAVLMSECQSFPK